MSFVTSHFTIQFRNLQRNVLSGGDDKPNVIRRLATTNFPQYYYPVPAG